MSDLLKATRLAIRQTSEAAMIAHNAIYELQRLKHDFKNGIPEEIIHSDSPDAGWKVQKAWFTDVSFDLQELVRDCKKGKIIIDPKLAEEIMEYNRKICTPEFQGRLTTQNDIDEAESMIDKVTKELQGRYL